MPLAGLFRLSGADQGAASGAAGTWPGTSGRRWCSPTSAPPQARRCNRGLDRLRDLFFLALTLGLEHDPPAAVERAVGLIEATGRRHGVQQPIQMTVATTDGTRVWAFRYSSEGQSRSLFYSTAVSTLRHQCPDNPVLHGLSDETRIVVSEPLGDLAGAWNEVPESS